MRFTRLTAENFLSYEALDLDLEGVWQVGVVGANGAGKSSLLDMVLYALFSGGRGSADELLREGSESMSVTVEFELCGRHYLVRRERSQHNKAGESAMAMTVDGEAVTGHTIRETQALLEHHLGVTQDALLAGPVMVQLDDEDPHDLMHLRQAARMDLLIGLFNLSIYEAYHLRVKEWQSEASTELAIVERHFTDWDELIAGELEAVRERDAQQDVVAVLDGEVDRLTEETATLREEAAALQARAQRQDELDRRMATLEESSDRAADMIRTLDTRRAEHETFLATKPALPPTNVLAAVQETVARAEGAVASFEGARQRHGELEVQYREAAKQAKVVDTVPCHGEGEYATCPLLAYAIDARSILPGIVTAGKSSKQAVEDLDRAEQHLAALRRDLTSTTDQQHAFERDQEKRERATAALTEIDQSKAEHVATLEQVNADMLTVNAERMRLMQEGERRTDIAGRLMSLTKDLDEAKTTRRESEERLRAAIARVAEIHAAKERRQTAEADRKRLAARVESLKLLAQATHRDGIPKLILEGGLPLLEERANEILSRMPGGYRVTIATQRELKTGGTREALEVIITAAGVERPYRMLSGGERFRVDFALRMALATVVARRSGTQIETLWLDEGWGSQDREGREALLEAIQTVVDEFRLIVVVSHVPEVTDAMPQRLEVTKDNGVSRVELVA